MPAAASASAPAGGPVNTSLTQGDWVSPRWSDSGPSRLTKRMSAVANRGARAWKELVFGSRSSCWPSPRPKLTSPLARIVTVPGARAGPALEVGAAEGTSVTDGGASAIVAEGAAAAVVADDAGSSRGAAPAEQPATM